TVELVETRARLMADAGRRREVPGGMRAVMGVTVERAEELAEAASAPGEPVVVALENAPGHVVVSGAVPGLDRLGKLATDAAKIVPLKVGDAYHSPLMAGAVPGWAEAVAAAPMHEPAVPVVPNVTGEPTTDRDVLREALVAQLTGRVRWVRTVAAVDAVAPGVEAGDSKVLAGLSRRAGARCLSMADPGTLRRLAKEVAA